VGGKRQRYRLGLFLQKKGLRALLFFPNRAGIGQNPGMPLLYLPDRRSFFLWEDEPVARRFLPPAPRRRGADSVQLVLPARKAEVPGRILPLTDTLARLAALSAREMATLPATFACWAAASRLLLALLARERVVPVLIPAGGSFEARWQVSLQVPADAAAFLALARSLPPAAHALPLGKGASREVWSPEALLRSFLDTAADALVRSAQPVAAQSAATPRPASRGRAKKAAPAAAWEPRLLAALQAEDAAFEPQGFKERALADDLARWSEPALGLSGRARCSLRLELPADGDAFFRLRYFLQAPDDPSLLVSAADVFKKGGRQLEAFGRAFGDAQESLLEALGRASRIFPPILASLEEARPTQLELAPAAAWDFLSAGAPALEEAGFGILVPAELTVAGRRRLRLRMKVGGSKGKVAGKVDGATGLDLDSLLAFEWQAALGDESLSRRELQALAKQKAALVRHRGQWIAVDPTLLQEIRQRLEEGEGRMTHREALAGALAGELRLGTNLVEVEAAGSFLATIEQLRQAASTVSASVGAAPPRGLRGTLRPYQERGLAWLATLASLGLGACLADDMGLGKTIQLLAFLLRRLEESPEDTRPALLVAPTSVVGNWEREAAKFAPDLELVRHYGPDRARSAKELAPTTKKKSRAGRLVLTTYGLLRRDAELLGAISWSVVALDEAQNIKSSSSATARAACALAASHRIALTGTPVENRLAELWSIFEFTNPRLLGPLAEFKRQYAVPIERFGNQEAAEKLRRVAAPFLLRRLKSDPAIAPDLPPKLEMKELCSLTREQATLYQAVVEAELARIEETEGGARRMQVLALLTFLKQICNHPAQYLGERNLRLEKRSGKLARLTAMLEEILAVGDKVLIFTQYREMGNLLVEHIAATFRVEPLFLHGGTSKKGRDEMVRLFQEGDPGPQVFVLSLKAGGTGLNLTAASHVFHYDRWWNPAVEDQATDRAYRIGQNKMVQVHKLLCTATIEERIDLLLEKKRGLAAQVVGVGEQWITELSNADLRELFSLGASAVAGDEEGESG